jgi:hypothetical protein
MNNKMNDIEKARELFANLECGKVEEKSVSNGRSTLEVLNRVRKGGGEIRQESLRRFKIQQRLMEVRDVKQREVLIC